MAIDNGVLVLQAMTALFVDRDLSAVEKYWSESYVQHNPTIPDGRDDLGGIISGLPENFRYEPGVVIADGEFVAIHGRYTGWAPQPLVAVDIFRIDSDGKLAEHWDVMQEEVPAESTVSGRSMFTGA
jgi:predicted SnoaL-like aldol condensation-catalyzing enzyme